MSTPEISLGASLYVEAVKADLPTLLKNGGAETPAEEFSALRGSFVEMGKWLVANKAVGKREDGSWAMNDVAIDGIAPEKAASFEPLYTAAVREHAPVMSQLIVEGRGSYADLVKKAHEVGSFEIDRETKPVLREEDMHVVAAASLSFLEIAHRDPVAAANVKGLSQENEANLTNALAEAGYLVPGENPSRSTPLSSQTPRGDREQQEAIYFAAAAVIANAEIAKTQASFGVESQAAYLRKAVQETRWDEQTTEKEAAADASLYFDSDLTRQDAVVTHSVFEAGVMLLDTSNASTQNPDEVMVRRDLLAAVRDSLVRYDEGGIANALKQKDFTAPGISTESGNSIYAGVEVLREIANLDVRDMRYTGDDGGALTEGGATMEDAFEKEVQLEDVFDRDEDDRAEAVIEDDGAHVDAASETFGVSDDYIPVAAEMMDEWDRASSSVIANGAGEALATLAGKGDRSILSLNSGRDTAAFISLQDAMGGGRKGGSPEIHTAFSETMSTDQWRHANAKRGTEIRAARIEPGRGAFAGLPKTAPHASAAPKLMANFIAQNMVDKDGKPNIPLRQWLREASRMPVVASTKPLAEAGRMESEKFVAREKEHFAAMNRITSVSRDMKSVEIPVEDARRWVQVLEASGSKDPGMLILGDGRNVTLKHEDAPRLDLQLDRLGNLDPTSLDEKRRGVDTRNIRPGYKMGMISSEQMRAAIETGSKTISIVVEDDRPASVVGKSVEQETTVVEKPKARYADVVLS